MTRLECSFLVTHLPQRYHLYTPFSWSNFACVLAMCRFLQGRQVGCLKYSPIMVQVHRNCNKKVHQEKLFKTRISTFTQNYSKACILAFSQIFLAIPVGTSVFCPNPGDSSKGTTHFVEGSRKCKLPQCTKDVRICLMR
jgi:hypothetical protein